MLSLLSKAKSRFMRQLAHPPFRRDRGRSTTPNPSVEGELILRFTKDFQLPMIKI